MWLPIPGYEGLYEASDEGEVRGLDRQVAAGFGSTRIARGQTLCPRPNKQGYLQLQLAREGRMRTFRVHQLVMLAFVGPCPEGMEVCHENDIPTDNRLVNLRYDTRPANSLDRSRNGRHSNGRRDRTHCPLDHLLVAPNLRNASDGRRCLSCTRARSWLRSLSPARRATAPSVRDVANRYYTALGLPLAG